LFSAARSAYFETMLILWRFASQTMTGSQAHA
jgi:hypothetical protein